MDERQCLEDGVRQKILRVIVATTTLAVGVDFPVDVVIMDGARSGNRFSICLSLGITPLSTGEFRQMAGRAGRKSEGVVYVFESRDKLREVVQLMNEQLAPVHSALGLSECSLARPLLEVISLNLVHNDQSLREYLTCSLIARQCSEEVLRANVCQCVGYLQSREVIHCYDYQGCLVIRSSRLGRAISSSSLPLEESVLLFRDLFAHQNCVCLDSTLFLVYLITPTFSIPAFSWKRFDKV